MHLNSANFFCKKKTTQTNKSLKTHEVMLKLLVAIEIFTCTLKHLRR